MPKLTLTDLVDIVSSSGVPKATKVAEVKSRPDYEPQFDFYKPLREAIQTMHQTGASKATLNNLLSSLSDKKKLSNYPLAIDGYKKWLGRKKIDWFTAPRAELSAEGVDVVINPELGLEIDGQRHVVKLYFKADKISKMRIDLIICAMEESLRKSAEPDDLMSVIDVRRGRLFSAGSSSDKLRAILRAELAYVATLWPMV